MKTLAIDKEVMSELIKELVMEKEGLEEELRQLQSQWTHPVGHPGSMGQGGYPGVQRQPLKQVTNVFEERAMRSNAGFQGSENYEENPGRPMPGKKLNFDPRMAPGPYYHPPGILKIFNFLTRNFCCQKKQRR